MTNYEQKAELTAKIKNLEIWWDLIERDQEIRKHQSAQKIWWIVACGKMIDMEIMSLIWNLETEELEYLSELLTQMKEENEYDK